MHIVQLVLFVFSYSFLNQNSSEWHMFVLVIKYITLSVFTLIVNFVIYNCLPIYTLYFVYHLFVEFNKC